MVCMEEKCVNGVVCIVCGPRVPCSLDAVGVVSKIARVQQVPASVMLFDTVEESMIELYGGCLHEADLVGSSLS